MYVSVQHGAALDGAWHLLEGEAAQGLGVSYPDTGQVWWSGGFYRQIDWDTAGPLQLCYWALSSPALRECSGRWFRLILRLPSMDQEPALLLRARLTLEGLALLWEGPWVKVDATRDLVHLGTAQVPPYRIAAGDLIGLRLELWGWVDAAGPHSAAVDWLQLCSADSFRWYDPQLLGWTRDMVFVDDPAGEEMYVRYGASGNVNWYRAAGGPLLVRPGCRHRLVMLLANRNFAHADLCGLLQAWYRPRTLVPV